MNKEKKSEVNDGIKRSISETTRAISGNETLKIKFSADPSGDYGDVIKLPQISKEPTVAELFKVRGIADSLALQARFKNEVEEDIIVANCPEYQTDDGRKDIKKMVLVAELTRKAFIGGDISTVMSPRTVIAWAQNTLIFNDIAFAFRMSFLNKCDELERSTVSEFFQRCFDIELPESILLKASSE